jgi:hypothetical protein
MTDENLSVAEGPGDPYTLDLPVHTCVVPKDQGDIGRAGHEAAKLILPPGAVKGGDGASYSGLSAEHRSQAKHIVTVYAHELLTRINDVHYTQDAVERWSGINDRKNQSDLFPFSGDCSSTATFMLWRALEHVHPGIADIINGEEFRGGYTGTIADHGKVVHHDANLQVGDLLLYGPAPTFEHVTVSMGGRICFSHGGEAGPFLLDIDYRPDRAVTKRFF